MTGCTTITTSAHIRAKCVVADNLVVFENRSLVLERSGEDAPKLDPDIYNDARIVAPGYDVHWLEREWRDMWVDTGRPAVHNPDAAFLAFCRRRAEKAPMG
jgi:hypothetical protein